TVMTYSAGGCGSSKSSTTSTTSTGSYAQNSQVQATYATCPSVNPSCFTTSGACTENVATETCRDCVTKFDCGVAATNTTLAGNCNGMGTSSFDLWSTLYDCFCGSDGVSGVCGSKCSKT